jgi:hypothetical protein
LLGNGAEVSNHFSLDVRTGRLWVAATAPDAEDGSVDGISELGALYGLDVVSSGPNFIVQEACHRYFAGGSASTPALRGDGGRIYIADNLNSLIAVDTSCTEQWTLDIGEQVIASVAVASDNDELYVPSIGAIRQVIDQGGSATVAWTATPEVFDLGFFEKAGNVNLVSIGANGVSFQYGAGRDESAPSQVGVGILDRETGAVRYFTGAFDESVAVMSVGPDGALYLGNSPFRRAIARVLFPFVTPPLVGGVRQYLPERLDLLIDDALCAAADRVSNAAAVSGTCPDSAQADIEQIETLIAQSRGAAPTAIAAGDLDPADWENIDGWLTRAEAQLHVPVLGAAVEPLEAACLRSPLPPDPPDVPALGLGVLAVTTGALGVIGAAGLVRAGRKR